MTIERRKQLLNRGLVFMFVLAAMVLGARSTPAQTAEVNVELATGGCLELENSSQQTNVRVKAANCNSRPEQRFTISKKPGSNLWFFKIGSGASNRCLEINSGNRAAGTNITQWPCDNSNEQSIQLDPNITTAHARIIFSHSGMCWDANGNFSFVRQMPCDGSLNQNFKLVSASTAAPTPVPTPVAPANSAMTNAQFLAGWAAATTKSLPLTVGNIILTNAWPVAASNHMELRGWTPALPASDSRRITETNALKPTLLADYCKVGAAARNIRLLVRVYENTQTSAHFYWLNPGDCRAGAAPTPFPAPVATPFPVPAPTAAPPPPPTAMTNAQFLNAWAAQERKSIPMTVRDIIFTNVFVNASADYLEFRGWTPNMTASDPRRITQADALRPAFTKEYCKSGAAGRNIRWLLRIYENTQKSGYSYWINPGDCAAAPAIPAPVPAPTPFPVPTPLPAPMPFPAPGTGLSPSNSNAAFMSNWAMQQGNKFPLTIGSITLTNASPNPSQNFVEVQGWTPSLSGLDPRIKQQADSLRPALLSEYCSSGAASRSIRMRVSILDNTRMMGTGTSYWINPNDCTVQGPVNPNPVSQEDQFWNSIQNSSNRQDFQNYLNRFGNNGKYAPIARLKLSQLPAGPGTMPPGNLTAEDQFWKSIEFSTNQNDFRNYLTRFGSSGKYASLARLKISQLPAPQSNDDQTWDRIKNSSDPRQFQDYMSAFPNGKHVSEAKRKKAQTEIQIEEENFLRNAEFGSLSEISAVRKVFVTATDFNSRSRIVSELQKKIPSLIIVGNRQSADFFIEYKLTVTMACDPGKSTAVNACELHTGKMWVHTLKLRGTGNEFNRILWTKTKSKSYSDQGVNLFTKNPAAQTVNDLIKDLKKVGF